MLLFGRVVNHVCAKKEATATMQTSESQQHEPNMYEHILPNHHRHTLSFAQQHVDVDTAVVQESVKPPLKVHSNATNVTFLVQGQRYRWSKIMSHLVENANSETLKIENDVMPISINKPEITNHSHAINAIIDFFNLEDMDVYLYTPNFIETINEDNGVRLALSTIYINHRKIEVQ